MKRDQLIEEENQRQENQGGIQTLVLDDREDLDQKIRKIKDLCVIVTIIGSTKLLDKEQKTDIRKFVDLVKADFHSKNHLNYGVNDYQPNPFIDVVEHENFDKNQQRPLELIQITHGFSEILRRFYEGAKKFGQGSIAQYYRNYILPSLQRVDDDQKNGSSAFGDETGFEGRDFPSKNASAIGLTDVDAAEDNPKELMAAFVKGLYF